MVVGPEPKVLQNRVRTIRQADRMAGSSVTFAQKHREPKTSVVSIGKGTGNTNQYTQGYNTRDTSSYSSRVEG